MAAPRSRPRRQHSAVLVLPKRIDYLFWADRAAGASQQGFVTARSDDRLGRSQFFGSDHRFVYGDAEIP